VSRNLGVKRQLWLGATDSYQPIVLKKSAMVSTTEKYALEIEIFALSMGFGAQISRSDAQKRRFQRSVWGQSGRSDFFNRIGRLLPVTTGRMGADNMASCAGST
jgi:hypothetical protein